MADLILNNVTKVFDNGVVALDRLSLTAKAGEYLVLLGPSGCGKTTALRLIAGLDDPTEGTIQVGHRIVNDLPPAERDLAMVFQNYALYPHMSVYENLVFGVKQRRIDPAEVEMRVKTFASMLGLEDLLDRKPGQLSGGQKQRVAMGRALVRQPQLYLLDEPLSDLDAKLRAQVRADLKRLHDRLRMTMIHVTHDQIEALTLADRVAVMAGGRLQQVGPPQEVYDHPANLFVASFIGNPPMNLLNGSAYRGVITAGDLALESPGLADGGVVIGIRAEHLRPVGPEAPGMDFLPEVVEPLGDAVLVHGTTRGQVAPAVGRNPHESLSPLPGTGATVTARFGPWGHPRPGMAIKLGVDPRQVYVFDAATGTVLRSGAGLGVSASTARP
jgi:sn-glycerol 3-phosphate transport system ATP-binding protein